MESPKKSYYKNRKDATYVKELQNDFYKYYVVQSEPNDAFRLDENDFTPKSKIIRPAKFYTFQYDPKYKDVLSFYDTRPVLFLHKIWSTHEHNLISGINFTFLPPMVKVAIMETYYQKFKQLVEKDESELWKENFININEIVKFFLDWLKVKELFEGYSNINMGFAYRSYIVNRISNFKIISYDDWDTIPFIRNEDTVGNSLGTIYNKYYMERIKKQNK
jgi:hypothetical protein